MGKGRHRRREERRERARAPKPPEPSPRPVDTARVVARLRHLVGRAVTLELVPVGPVVEAGTPAQLAAKVEEWLVAEAGMQRPS